MKLFAQLRKVDEEKRLIYARAAQEVVDHSGEIMDYDSSVPHFKKWSQDVAADTDGKSLGNVRAMHGKVAAGKLTGIDFNDGEKAVDVVVKVVDDGEWKKVLEGVYTGLSIGGSYIGDKKVEKMNGRDVTRYTAAPNEVSLVDRPCIPTAKFFEVQKADGSLAKVDFKEPAAEAEEGDLIVNGSADEVARLAKLMNDKGLSMADVLAKLEAPAAPAPAAAAAPAAAPAAPAGGEVKKVDAGALRKSMYSCSYLADTIASLISLKNSAQYEAFYEGDDSGIAKRLAAVIALAGQVLVEMVQEEVAEASAGASTDDTTLVVELSQKAGELAKFDGDPTMALIKAGARNSAADKERIGKIHDLSVELGHDCAGAAKTAQGDLAKLAPGGDLHKFVSDAVTAAVSPLNKALEDANAKIKKLEDQPAPARVSLRAVAKSADAVDSTQAPVEPEPVVDSAGEKHAAATLIKNLHQTGGAPLVAPLRK